MISSITELQQVLWSAIERYRPIRGEAVAPSKALRDAFFDIPRHCFVDRFRLVGDGPSAPVRASRTSAGLDEIYSNQPLMYVDADGRTLEASNSEPAFILHLVSLLDVRPGQRILEVGCGTGWLLAILSRLVGAEGHAAGVEIRPDLADAARENLRALGVVNATVITGDGAGAAATTEAFDRIIVTASMADISHEYYRLVVRGGMLVAPLRNRGLAEEVVVLDRTDAGFSSRSLRLCKFVRMTGADSTESRTGLTAMGSDPFWTDMLAREVARKPLPLADAPLDRQIMTLLPFSSYLSKTDPRFRAFRLAPEAPGGGLVRGTFGDASSLGVGLEDKAQGSACLWYRGELAAYADPRTAREFEVSFIAWNDAGRPTGADFAVDVVPRGSDTVTVRGGPFWREDRDFSTFLWRLPTN